LFGGKERHFVAGDVVKEEEGKRGPPEKGESLRAGRGSREGQDREILSSGKGNKDKLWRDFYILPKRGDPSREDEVI